MNKLSYVEELEDKGQWQSAIAWLEDALIFGRDKDIEIRYCFICWYVLIEYGRLSSHKKLSAEEYELKLRKVSDVLITTYRNDAEVNFYLGYMGSLASWLFTDDCDAWEARSTQMLQFSACKEADNPIYQMVYLANVDGDKEDYQKWCELAKPIVTKKYFGKGQFNAYFSQVLSR